MTKGLSGAGGALLKTQRKVDTAVGTVVAPNICISTHRSASLSAPNRPLFDGSSGSSANFKPISLAYRALECRGEERENQTKTPLLIHHSLYGRKENWNPVSEIINNVTKRKIINVDARNHGESPHTNEMSLPLMAIDIVHLIKQMKNGSDKISFMGHSMGGRIGIILALMYPQIMDKLVVVDASVIINGNNRQKWNVLREASLTLMNIESDLKKVQGHERLSLANKAIENIIVEKTERANFLSNLLFSDKLCQGSIWRVNISSYLSHDDMMSHNPAFNDACFEGSTLFINGDQSQFASRNHETEIRKVFPNAEFAWLKDCGHRPHLDKEKEFCEIVISFLEK